MKFDAVWPRNCYVSGDTSGDDRIGLPIGYTCILSYYINRNHIPFLISPLPGISKTQATIKSLHKSRPFCHSCWAEVWLWKNLCAASGNHAQKINQKMLHPNLPSKPANCRRFFSDVWRNSRFSQNTKPRFWDFPTSASSRRDTNDWSLKT